MNNYDYIIVGAGASGLLMVYRMSLDAFFNTKTILLLDKEQKTKNDRTWCFWEEPNGELEDVVFNSWKEIQFKSDTIDKVTNIKPYEYKMIRSADFYQKIWEVLAQKKNITFLKEEVLNISQEDKIAKVTTNKNEYSSQKILNSILFSEAYKNQNKYPVLQQHFVGYFIKTKNPVFNDAVATFMDFSIPQKGNTRFMYVLPTSKTEALFEYTLFSKDFLEIKEYTTAIEDYLAEKNITDYEIVEKEQGAIPMTCYKFWKQNTKNIIHIGTSGGWSKASTGFTFKNTIQKTADLIHYLKEDKPLTKFHKIDKFWFYDLLLLDILSKQNELGAAIFSQMFERNQPQNILKFLDEKTSIFEDLSIQLKMPIGLFTKALLKRIF